MIYKKIYIQVTELCKTIMSLTYWEENNEMIFTVSIMQHCFDHIQIYTQNIFSRYS